MPFCELPRNRIALVSTVIPPETLRCASQLLWASSPALGAIVSPPVTLTTPEPTAQKPVTVSERYVPGAIGPPAHVWSPEDGLLAAAAVAVPTTATEHAARIASNRRITINYLHVGNCPASPGNQPLTVSSRPQVRPQSAFFPTTTADPNARLGDTQRFDTSTGRVEPHELAPAAAPSQTVTAAAARRNAR